jgi:hypothetical protein
VEAPALCQEVKEVQEATPEPNPEPPPTPPPPSTTTTAVANKITEPSVGGINFVETFAEHKTVAENKKITVKLLNSFLLANDENFNTNHKGGKGMKKPELIKLCDDLLL